jgi:type III protein arginine methyltransferase
MINDTKRNKKFATAIESAIKKKKNAFILDIGSGTGILSVIAARHNENENHTFACEQNEVMCKIARETFKLNAVEVKLFEMHSKTLLLPSGCDILITETVDSAIFGERIVDTVRFRELDNCTILNLDLKHFK